MPNTWQMIGHFPHPLVPMSGQLLIMVVLLTERKYDLGILFNTFP